MYQSDNEERVGFAFDNPDLTSDHYYPDWGLPVTPDELRYLVTFGTKLVASDANQTFTDENLQYYIDNAIGLIEADLQIDIYPRMIRHEDPIAEDGSRTARDDILSDDNLVREPGYPYKQNHADMYLYIKLRRRPLIELLKAEIVDPIQNRLIDIYSWRKEKPGLEAKVQFFPRLGVSVLAGYPWIMGTKKTLFRYPFDNFPNAIMIDYKTGWENCETVPKDLIELIRKLAGIMLLSDFGDGRSAALASASANLNSISESFNTTMSATSAMYGARIMQWQKEIKTWWSRNYRRYKRADIGFL